MRRLARFLTVATVSASIVLGCTALVGVPARAAGDNPCDPTYNMLKNCKAQHGRWDSSCCCCKLH